VLKIAMTIEYTWARWSAISGYAENFLPEGGLELEFGKRKVKSECG